MSISDAFPGTNTLREQWLLIMGVLFALFGLNLVDMVLPPVGELVGPAQWVVLIGPHWLVAGLVVAGVLGIERRGLDSIGVTWPSTRELGLAVAGFLVGVLAFGVTQPLVQVLGLDSTRTGLKTLAMFPTWVVVLIALTAGVTEEVLFRGYPIERLSELTGELWIGAAVTYLVFTAGHIPFWGLGGALQISAWTLVVTVLYVRTRNLIACMVMHIANDLFAFVVLPVVFNVGLIM